MALIPSCLIAAMILALVTTVLRRWRLSASVAGAAAAGGLIFGLLLLARLYLARPSDPRDVAQQMFMLERFAEALSFGVPTLFVVLVTGILWLLARRRLRPPPAVAAFLSGREQLLKSDNPMRAFVTDPSRDTEALRPGQSNEQAYALLGAGTTSLRRLHDGARVPVTELDRLLFVEAWDILSASAIGSHMRAFQEGKLGSFGIVFVTSGPKGFDDAEPPWYRSVALALDEADPLRVLIAAVPFVAVKGPDGTLTFHEGLEDCRHRANDT